MKDAVLTLHSGHQRAGDDLREIVEQARTIKRVLDNIPDKYPKFVVEQAAIAGALNLDRLADPDKAQDAADYIARRLDLLSPEVERGWSGEPMPDGGLAFSREVRSVRELRVIDQPLLESSEARRLDYWVAHLQEVYGKMCLLERKDTKTEIRSPSQLLDAVLSVGSKGITMQRYKGLGEMNPDQLWETTLDVENRTLLQVKINELDEADEMFSKLMGDVVEPRREFIRENALSVENLDI